MQFHNRYVNFSRNTMINRIVTIISKITQWIAQVISSQDEKMKQLKILFNKLNFFKIN
jgi:hypothetical protein